MAGLHPKDPKDVFKGEILWECMVKDGSQIWANSKGIPEEEPAKTEFMKERKEVVWPLMCKNFERYVTEESKFVAGETMTTHDYTVGIMLINVFKNPKIKNKEFWDELWA